ncbi:ABC transporter permease subunit [Actinomadura viridis]|uniref:ABC transporter permease subunit n=1 Tax=Actinomadura viridis TaxID=58110 RepID=UPI00369B638B
MIWLTWRQFRVQAIVTGAALLVLAIYLILLGLDVRDSYDAALARCGGGAGGGTGGGGAGGGTGGACTSMTEFQDEFRLRLRLLGVLLLVAPGLLGMFWGAPLVAREYEAGTHRLVWSQSVTRRRWLAVKLLVVGLAAMAATGLAGLLLTWAAGPFDQVAGDRFDTTQFAARHIVPVAYAAFAFTLGAALGLLLRRTVPAMALTLVVFTVVQVAGPTMVRPHLVTPVETTRPMTTEAIKSLQLLGRNANIGGLRIPDAWVVSTSRLLTPDGRPIDNARYEKCLTGALGDAAVCLDALDLHVEVAYQPGDRYWTFQWLESAIFLALSALLASGALWRLRRRP